MWDFKFDAPQYFNFFRPEKPSNRIDVDFGDPDDQWFMLEHIQITPIKKLKQEQEQIRNQIQKLISIDENWQKPLTKQQRIKTGSKQISNRIMEIKKMEPKYKVKKLKRVNIEQKNNDSTSNSVASIGSKIQNKGNRNSQRTSNLVDSRIHKISKAKSESSQIIHEKQKIKIPCPYPLRAQRDWETKSNKSWYNLTQQSAKRALLSIKKLCKQKKKSPKKQKPRFKF